MGVGSAWKSREMLSFEVMEQLACGRNLNRAYREQEKV